MFGLTMAGKRWGMKSIGIRMYMLLGCLALATAGLAQDTGAITGTVRDNTGAVVPNAEVTIVGTGQGTTVRTTSNTEGEYLVAALPAGVYNLTVTASGFKQSAKIGGSPD